MDMAIQNRLLQTCVVNFICQKVQNFWADSDYLGKISNIFFKILYFQYSVKSDNEKVKFSY